MNIRTLTLLIGLTPALGNGAESDPAMNELKDRLEATRAELDALREQVNSLQPVLPALAPALAFGTEPRPMLGIVMSDGPDNRGVRLSAVTPDAPADKAGLQAGDLVRSINGQTVDGRNATARAYELLQGLEQGQQFVFEIERDGKRQSFEVVAELVEPTFSFAFSNQNFGGDRNNYAFGWNSDNQKLDLETFRDWARQGRNWSVLANSGRMAWPDPTARAGFAPRVWGLGLNWADLELAALNPDLGRYFGAQSGVLVIDSQLPDSPLRAGDVILKVAGKTVSEPSDALRELRRFDIGEEVLFDVLRDGQEMAVNVATPQPPENSFFYQFRTESATEQ